MRNAIVASSPTGICSCQETAQAQASITLPNSAENAITHQFDDSTIMGFDQRRDDILDQGRQGLKRSGFVVAHHSGIADNIRSQDRSQSSFHKKSSPETLQIIHREIY